jgi:transposase
MRGQTNEQPVLFSYIPTETRIPPNHPLRRIRAVVDEVLVGMSKKLDRLYSHTGRPSIPPEHLLKAMFLQILYTIRSEGQLVEHLHYNLLYQWFVGLKPDDKVWDESVFTKNRARLLQGDVAEDFFGRVLAIAEEKKLVSKDHFSVDGTLIEAWASLKSFMPKNETMEDRKKDDDDPGNPSVNFKGEKRSNETHESKTDPESRLYTKSSGATAKLNYMGHVLMENRNGLAVEATLNQPSGHAEHEAALEMIKSHDVSENSTLGGDKNYDNHEFCDGLKKRGVRPHVAQNIHARRKTSAIDSRTTRHWGYEVSTRKRKRIEEIFGWLKTIGPLRKMHLRGKRKVAWLFKFAVAVYNVVRICNLEAQTA